MKNVTLKNAKKTKYLNRNKKGFTLIEILAVVIIISIIGIIGVAAISSYIEDSRKSAFVTTAHNYIDAARSLKASDKLIQEPKDTEAVLIPLSMLELEDNEGFKTSYGEIDETKSYVIITNNNNKLTYYITLIDETGHALLMENADEFSKDSIQVGNLDIAAIHEHAILKKNEEGMTIEINGIPYQVSNRDYKETKKDDPNTYVTTTILLDCNAIDTVRVEVEEGWTNKDKTIKILTLNNKENYKYYLSERSMKPLRSDSEWSDSNTYERDLGTYYAFVKTDAGEISDPVKVIVDKIDRIAPTCELEVYEGTISSYGIYKTDAKIRFKEATDGVASSATSGVKSHGIGSFTGSKTVTDSLTGEIENTYIGHIQDNAGNTNTCEITVKSDGSSPTVTYNLASGSYSTTQNVVITPSDEGHGLDYYNIKVTKNGTVTENKTNLTASTYTVTMSDNGKYTVATKVVDKANNSIKQTPLDSDGYFYREYIIDKVTPTVTLTAKKKTSGTTVASGVWSDEGLNFTLTAGTVGYSGATIYYCKDTANTCTPNTKATSGTAITSYNSTTGTYYIRYKIVSGAGLSSAVASYTAKVDTSNPTITSVTGNPTNWTNQDVTLTINATDTPSGLHSTPYSFDGGSTWQTSSSKTFSSNQTVNIVVRDVVGNTSSKTITISKIDKVVPTCTNDGDSTTWTNSTRTISYGCSDSESGCNSSYSGGSTTFTSTTKTSTIASYTIKDEAGNTVTCSARTANVYVDTTSPTCSVAKSDTGKTTGVTSTVTCDDSDSQCVSSNPTGDSGLTSSKTYTVSDVAGNTGICTVTVTSQLQKRTASCSNCQECSGAGCKTRNSCSSCSACGESWSSYSGGTCHSSKPSNTTTKKYSCVMSGKMDSPACNNSSYYYCQTSTRSCKSCQNSSCSCKTYNTSCSTCGCEGWGSWGSWADATSCSAGESSDHKTKTGCQTVYN